jgi:hypothetical protein
MKEVRYYLRDKQRKPLVTVVLLVDEPARMCYRGISICSHLDQPEKREGYKRAKKRANAAIAMHINGNRFTGFPIYREEAEYAFNKVGVDPCDSYHCFKASAIPIDLLNDFEKQIIQRQGVLN